jgi:hypothetical protein
MAEGIVTNRWKEKRAQREHHTGGAAGSCAASASGHVTPVPVVPSQGRLQPENLKQPWAADGPTLLRTGGFT